MCGRPCGLQAHGGTGACTPAGGASHGPCCWLKNCACSSIRGSGCSFEKPFAHCESWSGTSGRASPPPPAPTPPPLPPPPPPCPPGEKCFHNHGTRPGVTKSFDCEVRKHAYEFAQKTLLSRGSFKTAYDALQLR